MRTALIVHGYSLFYRDWETVMLGEKEAASLGRLPMSLLLIHHRRPELIIWTTGSSQKDGMREADYILHYTCAHLDDLCARLAGFGDSEKRMLEERICRNSATETESMRTSETLINVIPYLVHKGRPAFDEVLQVSSKNHVSRVLRDSMKLWWEERGLMIPTSVYPSHTGYAGGTAGEVEIQELSAEKRGPYDAERIAGLGAPLQRIEKPN